MLSEAESLPEFEALQNMRTQMLNNMTAYASKYPVLIKQLTYLKYIGRGAVAVDFGSDLLEIYEADYGQRLRTTIGVVGEIGGGFLGGLGGGWGGFYIGGPVGGVLGTIGGSAYFGSLGKEWLKEKYDEEITDDSQNNGVKR